MRTRNKKWTAGELADNALIVSDLAAMKGHWRGDYKELRLEIGCGKGKFAVDSAAKEPGVAFVALEREPIILAAAARLARENNVGNLRFALTDAAGLADIFGDGEVDVIYLNFSDPWHRKKKWAKRRLTHRSFLDIYARILSGNGKICLKTDNDVLFDSSLNEFAERGWRLSNVTRDLHKEPYAASLTTTEYEERFVSMGQAIKRLEAFRPQ